MNNDQSPWSKPDPRWQPQDYRDVQGRDPMQPFGAPSQPESGPSSIDDYRAPGPGRIPWWLLVLAFIAVVALILVALQVFGADPDVQATPAASTSASRTAPPSPTDTGSATVGNSIPFEGNGTGTFELLTENWDATGVTLNFKVSVDSGRSEFVVYLFENDSMAINDPVDLTAFDVEAGTPATFTARFEVRRGPGTLVLASSYGQALTALPIRG